MCACNFLFEGMCWLYSVLFFHPQLESQVTCLATKVRFVIVYFSNHASVLGLQLKKASLRKFLCYYKLPLYMRSWNVNHSLNYFSDVSLSIFTHCELLLRLCYHSNGHSSPVTPSLHWLYGLLIPCVRSGDCVSVGWLGSVYQPDCKLTMWRTMINFQQYVWMTNLTCTLTAQVLELWDRIGGECSFRWQPPFVLA